MNRRLILLRHGLTSWNAEQRFQGQADIELTELGHVQAKAAAQRLASYSPVLLWSSDLSRAVQTAEYVAEATQLVPVLDQRLREIHVGDLQGLHHDEVVARYGHGPWDYAQYGGESDAEVAGRVVDVIAEAVDALEDGQTGVLVAHGAAIRFATLRFLGWPPAQVATVGPLDNCGWVELIDAPATGRTEAAWRLAAYNRVAPIS